MEENKEKLKINWKDGAVYFLIRQIEVLVVATFLTMLNTLLIRSFMEPSVIRDIVECVGFFITEITVLFFVNFFTFKNNRYLTFKQFSLSYIFTLILRFVLSAISSFAAWTAGMAICLTGSTFASLVTNPEVAQMTPEKVPFYVYLCTFILFEAIVYLVVFLAYKLSCFIRSREREKLLSESENQK